MNISLYNCTVIIIMLSSRYSSIIIRFEVDAQDYLNLIEEPSILFESK